MPVKRSKVQPRAQHQENSSENSNSHEEPGNALYRLEVLEEDLTNDRVRIRYIGYEGDEWRARSDIVDLCTSDSDSNNESESEEAPVSCTCNGRSWAFPTCLSLYELLAYKIKSLLVCSLKGDPACHISMPFDSIHFDGIMRSVPVQGRVKSYTLAKLTNLDEMLGKRWYIRGINAAGDFSYVKPETLRFYLRKSRSKTDYQWEKMEH